MNRCTASELNRHSYVSIFQYVEMGKDKCCPTVLDELIFYFWSKICQELIGKKYDAINPHHMLHSAVAKELQPLWYSSVCLHGPSKVSADQMTEQRRVRVRSSLRYKRAGQSSREQHKTNKVPSGKKRCTLSNEFDIYEVNGDPYCRRTTSGTNSNSSVVINLTVSPASSNSVP